MSKGEEKKPLTKQQRAAIKKKKKQKKMILLIVEILVLLILAIILFVAVKMSRIEKDISFNKEDIQVNEGIPEQSVEIMEGYTTIAIFGLDAGNSVDSEGNAVGSLDVTTKTRSDVIMIASINHDTEEVKLVSVYRDTYLDIGDSTFKKCNSAYAAGGPEQAINMLNKNLDLNITDYVTVDFNAVVECVDLLGGVTVEITDLEATMMKGYIEQVGALTGNEDEAVQLSGAGTYNLNGVQACAYARVRQTAGDDFARTERQRLIISLMVEKAQQSDLATVNKIIDTVFSDIRTSLTNTEMLNLASKIFAYQLGEMSGFPFEKNTTTLGSKGSVVVPCDLESNVDELHVFLYGDEEYEPTAAVKEISQKIVSDTGFYEGDGY